MLALGQALGDQVFQRFQILSMLRGNRHDLGVGQLLGEPAQMRQQLGLVLDAVGLVHRHDQRPGNVLYALQHSLVLIGPAGTIDDENHHVDVLQRGGRGAVHVAVERGLAVLVQARGIDIDRLHAALGLDAEHVVTGGLRLARGDRQLLPENMVEQGRLADVRPADDSDVATTADGIVLRRFKVFSHVHSPRQGR